MFLWADAFDIALANVKLSCARLPPNAAISANAFRLTLSSWCSKITPLL